MKKVIMLKLKYYILRIFTTGFVDGKCIVVKNETTAFPRRQKILCLRAKTSYNATVKYATTSRFGSKIYRVE